MMMKACAGSQGRIFRFSSIHKTMYLNIQLLRKKRENLDILEYTNKNTTIDDKINKQPCYPPSVSLS